NNPTSGSGSPAGSHTSLTRSNASFLQKVTSSWNENTITWNNQPATTTTNQVTLAQSTDPHQDYSLDVTTLVQNRVTTPATNFGFMLRLQTELNYAALVFASSDNADITRRPKLSLTYNIPLASS